MTGVDAPMRTRPTGATLQALAEQVEDLVAHARAHLAATEHPREAHVVDAIPLTSVGTLDRKALRARSPGGGGTDGTDRSRR